MHAVGVPELELQSHDAYATGRWGEVWVPYLYYIFYYIYYIFFSTGEVWVSPCKRTQKHARAGGEVNRNSKIKQEDEQKERQMGR